LSGPLMTTKGKKVKSVGNFRDLPESVRKASLAKLAKLTGKEPSDEPKIDGIASFLKENIDGITSPPE